MKTKLVLSALGFAMAAVFAPTARAQEIILFPPAPSASTSGLTIQDSTCKKRVEPKRLADGAPNIFIPLDESLDVGEDTGTPVNLSHDVPFKFTGRIENVNISLK